MSDEDPMIDAKSSDNKPTVWLVTDVRFWELRNGSHQRIMGILRALAPRTNWGLWFIGSISDDEKLKLSELQIFSTIGGPAFPPHPIIRRLKWHWDGTKQWIRNTIYDNGATTLLDDAPSSMALPDFEVPEVSNYLVQDLRSQHVDALLFEYITCSYLAKAVKTSLEKPPLCILDTHDLLHRRYEAFQSQGLPHWIRINEEEEAKAFREFDTLMAIEASEAEQMANMAPDVRVICCPFGMKPITPLPKSAGRPEDLITVGFLAGAGKVNEEAIRRFIRDVWKPFMKSDEPNMRLLVGGRVGRRIMDVNIGGRHCSITGDVPSLDFWYRRIDISINPVEFGAGFKIKSLESLAYGVCLISTREGLKGMEGAIGQGAAVVESTSDWMSMLKSWSSSEELRKQMSGLAREYVRKHHDPVATIEPLWECIKSTQRR